MKIVQQNTFKLVLALGLALAVFGCDGDTGAGGPGSNMNDTGGNTGGDTGDKGGETTKPDDMGGKQSGGSMKRCFDDDRCPDDEYCKKDDPSDDNSVGACVPGCRPGAEDPSGEGRICDPETRQFVDKPCESDDDCDMGEYCDTSGDPNECKEGCREGSCETSENGRPQICDEMTRQCVETFPCCKKDQEMCTTVTRDACADEGDRLFEGDAACAEDTCTRARCMSDDECGDDEYCNESDQRCLPGCRPGEENACAPGRRCNPDNRQCEEIRCENNDDCGPGRFCGEVAGNQVCLLGDCGDDSDCDAGQRCSVDAQMNPICVDDCNVQGHPGCPENQVCHPDGMCRPACMDNDDCDGADLVCNQETGFCIMGCRDDDSEPNNSVMEATAIMLGEEVALDGSANIQPGSPTVQLGKVENRTLCENDTDVYSVSVPAGRRVRIDVKVNDDGNDNQAPQLLEFDLTGSAGPCNDDANATCDPDADRPNRWICQDRVCIVEAATIREAQAAARPMGFSRVDYPEQGVVVPEQATYYITVNGMADTIKYDVNVAVVDTQQGCFPDGREPDNIPGNATGLPQGVSADAPFTGTLCGLADEDFFAIDLAAGDKINLNLTNNDQNGFPLKLELYRDAANIPPQAVPTDYQSGDRNFVPGRYLIRVSLEDDNMAGIKTAEYTLEITHVPAAIDCGDDDQPGDVVAAAANPNINPAVDMTTDIAAVLDTELEICGADEPDVDVFCFEAQPGEGLGAAVVSGVANDLLVEWRSADNRVLNSGRSTAGADRDFVTFNVNVPQAAVYCVYVAAIARDGNEALRFPYQLFIKRESGDDMCRDDAEAVQRNDIASRATPLVANQEMNPTEFTLPAAAAICDGATQEEDWYRFTVSETQSSVCVTLNQFDPVDADFDLAMYPAQASPADTITCNAGQGDCDRPRQEAGNMRPGGACIPNAAGAPHCTPSFNDSDRNKFDTGFEMINKDRGLFFRDDTVGDYLLRVYKAKNSNRNDVGSYNLNVVVTPRTDNCTEDANTPNGDDNRLMPRDLGSGDAAVCDSWLCIDGFELKSDWFSIDVPPGEDRTVIIEYAKETEGTAYLFAYPPVDSMNPEDVFSGIKNPGMGESKRSAGGYQCINVRGGEMGDDRKVYIEVEGSPIPAGANDIGRLDYAIRVVETDLDANPTGACERFGAAPQPVCGPDFPADDDRFPDMQQPDCWVTIDVP